MTRIHASRQFGKFHSGTIARFLLPYRANTPNAQSDAPVMIKTPRAPLPTPGSRPSRPVPRVAFLVFAVSFFATISVHGYECVVCEKGPLVGKVWKHTLGHVCQSCYESPRRCSECGLPAPNDFLQTADGRVFCRRDRVNLVVDPHEVQDTFTRARSMLWEMLGPRFRLKSPDVTVNAFDVDYWNHRNGQPVEAASRRKGLAQTRLAGDQMVHTVLLLSGQREAELLSVCAHEYTHLWINENRVPGREVERETIEAICELVAFKLMGYRREPAEQDRIRENTYTNGRIHDLIAIERERGMAWILNWVKSGSESESALIHNPSVAPDASSAPQPAIAGQIAALRPPQTPPTSRRANHEKLKLQGLSGSGTRRFALINGKIVGPNEEASVIVNGKVLRFKCLELHDDAAVIRIAGSSTPQRLSLSDSR